MPDSAFGGNFGAFLGQMKPEEKHRVVTLTLKLLATIRMGSVHDDGVLRAAALMELHLSGAMPISSLPSSGHVSYGPPPQ